YAPCLEVPARARLAALGGAPAAEPPAPAPPPPPPAPPARVADASCTTYANARSERWDQPMDFRVTNRTDMTLSVAWINYDGVRQSVGSIDPGASFGGGTYVTHPFEFTGPDGACVMIVMPQMGVTDYYIGR
ncbi:MAG: hypothetical protein KDK12_18790, partial [Rhodobacteraceae bacterium]|nr:hypothetical protein [Paracoccaceae bacterium]